MKHVMTIMLTLTVLANSLAFASSNTEQENLKKGLNGFVAKVTKEQNLQKKRIMIAKLIDSTNRETKKALAQNTYTNEELESIMEFQQMNEGYRMALHHVEAEDLNEFSEAYVTEYQKAIPIVAIYLIVGFSTIWMVMCNIYGAGCIL